MIISTEQTGGLLMDLRNGNKYKPDKSYQRCDNVQYPAFFSFLSCVNRCNPFTMKLLYIQDPAM